MGSPGSQGSPGSPCSPCFCWVLQVLKGLLILHVLHVPALVLSRFCMFSRFSMCLLCFLQGLLVLQVLPLSAGFCVCVSAVRCMALLDFTEHHSQIYYSLRETEGHLTFDLYLKVKTHWRKLLRGKWTMSHNEAKV